MNRLSSALAPGLLALSLSTHAQVSTRSLLALDDFPLPDGEVRLVWDAERAAIYCADPAGQRVQKLALTDGAVLGELTWTNSPDQLALSPNGGELFVSLPIRPHDGMWFEDQWGYVSVIDPATFAELRRFRVDIDPYDIAPSSEGTMIVSSGSGQWTYLDTYDAITGGRLGTASGVIPQLARLTLHAGGDRLYLADYSVLQRLDRDPGTRTVGLEVRDPFGAVSTTTRSVEVSLAEDPGEPGPPHAPSTLPFEAARVAFDAARGRLYATDPAGKRLAVVNLHSGQMIRQFRFFLPPESVALTPDGRQLYVALLAAPHDSFASGGGSGYVAVFDLDRLVKTREFAVSVDPGALLATDAGHVVVGGGSSQSTEVQSYHGGNSQWLGSISARELSPLALLPSQVALLVMEEFAGNAWSSNLPIRPRDSRWTLTRAKPPTPARCCFVGIGTETEHSTRTGSRRRALPGG